MEGELDLPARVTCVFVCSHNFCVYHTLLSYRVDRLASLQSCFRKSRTLRSCSFCTPYLLHCFVKLVLFYDPGICRMQIGGAAWMLGKVGSGFLRLRAETQGAAVLPAMLFFFTFHVLLW